MKSCKPLKCYQRRYQSQIEFHKNLEKKPVSGFMRFPHIIRNMIKTWQYRHQSRKQLAEMSEYLIKDIGISKLLRDQETRKPFWKK